ncbi:MAG: hypothetical protein PHE52_00780 [Candidatus Pacebacteria bacterium]|nr:hypothetical protein [Candidatus Paceibacterota bacterium]
MTEELKNNSETIKEIQDRYKSVLLIAIFFYTVMTKLFDIYEEDKAGESTITYAGLISFYFIVYLLFEISKNKLTPIWLRIINNLTLVGIGIFIIPMLLFVFVGKIPSNIFLTIFKIPLWGILLIPAVLTGIISWTSSFKR